MAQKISQMTEQTTASMTEAGTSDFLGGYTATSGNANRKFSLSGLANYFLNKFKMTLGGSSQTVKSAIDTLNSKVVVSSTINTLPTNPVAGAYFVSAGDSSFPTNFGMLEIKKVSTTNSSEFVGLYYGTPTANARRIYMNYYHANLGGWQGWFTTASQADVDALNSNKANGVTYSISGNIPTESEFLALIDTLPTSGSSYIVSFMKNGTLVTASALLSMINRNYGYALIITYYDHKIYTAINDGHSVTIAAL